MIYNLVPIFVFSLAMVACVPVAENLSAPIHLGAKIENNNTNINKKTIPPKSKRVRITQKEYVCENGSCSNNLPNFYNENDED